MMTKAIKFFKMTRWNYRQARMKYELGSDDFRFKFNAAAVASICIVSGIGGWYWTGWYHGF
jgi:hypothetical protein